MTSPESPLSAPVASSGPDPAPLYVDELGDVSAAQWERAREITPRLDGSTTRTSPSDHLGSCGHPLDAWETHLEHAPGCARELCLDDRCDCPEVCPDCCRACGYDLAERMGS